MATKAMTPTQLFRHLAESCQLSNKVARQCMEALAETALERDQAEWSLHPSRHWAAGQGEAQGSHGKEPSHR